MQKYTMNSSQQSTLRAAGAIRQRLAERQQDRDCIHLPVRPWAEMQRLHRLIERAQRQGWHGAVRRLTEAMRRELDTCHYRLLEVLATVRQWVAAPPLPTQADVYREILALRDANTGEICVTTDPIVLEDISLGRFEIRLDWKSSGSGSPYRVVALNPHPAASNSDVTHPHVQGETLCEGEGRTAIRAALAEGRLCDFFLVVTQILSTYARGSAYVELDQWEGESCYSCGRTVCEDERCSCARCGETLCGECCTSCEDCHDGYCPGCISQCQVCGSDYCSSCLTSCAACHKAGCSNCLQDGLCRRCHEQQHQDENEPCAAAATQSHVAVSSHRLGQTAIPPRPG